MLVIKVELHPFGNSSKKKELARAIVANVGSGEHPYTYNYMVGYHEPAPLFGDEIKKAASVTNYARTQPLPELLSKAMSQVINGAEIHDHGDLFRRLEEV